MRSDAPIVIEPPSSALDGASNPSAPRVRRASAAAPRRSWLDQDIASGVMAAAAIITQRRRGSVLAGAATGGGVGAQRGGRHSCRARSSRPPPAVAKRLRRNRSSYICRSLFWRASSPIALQADAIGDLPDAVLRTLAGFGPRESGGGSANGHGWLALDNSASAADQTRLRFGSRMGRASPSRHGAGGRASPGRARPTAASPRSRGRSPAATGTGRGSSASPDPGRWRAQSRRSSPPHKLGIAGVDKDREVAP